jgi:hypothetical protein
VGTIQIQRVDRRLRLIALRPFPWQQQQQQQ